MEDAQKTISSSLKLAGILLIFIGILPILISIPLGSYQADKMDALLIIASVFSGIGIMRLSNFWRIVGIGILVCDLIVYGLYIIGLAASVNDTPQNEKNTLFFTIAMTGAIFLLMVFILTVLMRSATAVLFKDKK